MKVFYDTEFLEDGKTIGLLSIGLVTEDSRELYLVIDDEDTITRAAHHPWLRANVLPSLPVQLIDEPHDHYGWDWNSDHDDWANVTTRNRAADTVREFLQSVPDLELWAWYGAYDHVVLAQLFGRMIDLPEGVPMWTNDLKQECQRVGNPKLPKQESAAHNALEDARWVRDAFFWLATSLEPPRSAT